MRFLCKIGIHKYKDKITQRTKNAYFGFGQGLPGMRVKQECFFCGKQRYISLNLMMPNKLLYDEKLWK